MRSWLRQHRAALVIIVAMFMLAMITVPALAGPFSLSDVSAGNITTTSAVITWSTDEPGNSTVNYGTTTPLSFTALDSTFVTNHVIDLSALTPATLYYFEVSSTSEAGNITLVDNNGSAYYTFHTSPAISAVQTIDINIGNATITWTTDIPATSVVNYGETTGLGLTASDSNPVTSHSIALSVLSQNTTYYYEVKSTDGEGNTVTDDNSGEYYTFTTQDFMTELTKPIGDLVVKALTAASSTLNILVDPAQEEPLTEKGTQLVDVVSRFIAGVVKVIGRILAFAH